MNYEEVFKIPVHSSELPDPDEMEEGEKAAYLADLKISQAVRDCFSTPEGITVLNYLYGDYIIPEIDGINGVAPSGEQALIKLGARAVVVDLLKRIRIAEELS